MRSGKLQECDRLKESHRSPGAGPCVQFYRVEHELKGYSPVFVQDSPSLFIDPAALGHEVNLSGHGEVEEYRPMRPRLRSERTNRVPGTRGFLVVPSGP